MTALEYANSHSSVIVRWAGVGCPAGTETFLGDDTALPFDLHDVDGRVRADGSFEGDGLPDLRDSNGNTIYAVWLREDASTYDRLREDWETAV